MTDIMDTQNQKTEESDEIRKMWAGSEADDKEIAYYRSIDECAEAGSNKFIENSKPAHATYLMMKMFQNAALEVRLFSGGLERVYASEKLISEVINFLEKRGGTLKIVVEKNISGGAEPHPFIEAINGLSQKLKEGQVVVRKLSGEFVQREKKHFMVMDAKAYRIEYDHDNTKALANFGDSEIAAKWVNYFDNVLVKKSDVVYSNKMIALQ